MREALLQAELAYAMGEVPVGAVVVNAKGEILAKAHNRTIHDQDPSAHAEVLALRQAAQQTGNHRLMGCRLYITLEPCMMCMGAIFHARLQEVIFGASDPKTGVCGGVIALHSHAQLNHQTQITTGVLAPECANLLQQFFQEKRRQKRNKDEKEI